MRLSLREGLGLGIEVPVSYLKGLWNRCLIHFRVQGEAKVKDRHVEIICVLILFVSKVAQK